MIRVIVRKKSDRSCYQLYYRDPLTKLDRTKGTGTHDRKKAERAAEKWETEINEKGITGGPLSWVAFRIRFEDEYLPNTARKTQLTYGTALNRFEKIVGKPTDIRLIRASVLSQFHTGLLKEDLSKSTRANYLRHVQAALSWAHSQEMISVTPKLRLPKGAKKSGARARPVTEAEFYKMLEVVPEACPWNSTEITRVLWFLWYSGFRENEAAQLRWDSGPVQVDLYSEPLPRFLFEAEGQKSRNREAISMMPDCMAFLELTPPEQRCGRVFNVPLSNKLGRIIGDVGKAAGVVVNDKGKFASAHDLRRSFGTRWSWLVPPAVLQQMMRHADSKTTYEFYVNQEVNDAGAVAWKAAGVPPPVPPDRRLREKTLKTPRAKPEKKRVA